MCPPFILNFSVPGGRQMAGMNFQTRPGPVYILSWGNRNGNNTFTELDGNGMTSAGIYQHENAAN